MLFPGIITALALILYQVLTFNVGRARGKYGIKAPAMVGHLEFEKRYRVQANTLEQLIVFLPALWLFCLFWPKPFAVGNLGGVPLLASVMGLIWIVGRILYARAYYVNPEKRYLGMILTLLSSGLLTLATFLGMLYSLATIVMK